jgi:hypothetical protein
MWIFCFGRQVDVNFNFKQYSLEENINQTMWYHEIDLGCLFAPVCGDSRGDCYIWSSENGDFSIVGVRMEEKTLSQGSRHLSLQIFQIRLLVNFFCYIYLKILCIYFVMHCEIFWLWVLYGYAYFTIHYEMFCL